MTNDNERTPLVGSGPPCRDPSSDSPSSPAGTGVTWRRYIWYILILVLTQIASSIAGAPYLRLLESVVCKNYYDKNDPSVIRQDGTIPEIYCKKTGVQEAVALIQTFQQLFNFGAGKSTINISIVKVYKMTTNRFIWKFLDLPRAAKPREDIQASCSWQENRTTQRREKICCDTEPHCAVLHSNS